MGKDLEQVGKELTDRLLEQALGGGSIKAVLMSLALAVVVAVITAVLVFRLRAVARAEHKLAVEREKKKMAEVEGRTDENQKKIDDLSRRVEEREKKLAEVRHEAAKLQKKIAALHQQVLPDFD